MQKNPIKFSYSLFTLILITIIYIIRDYVFSINNQSPLRWSLNIASNGTDVIFWLPFIQLIFIIYRTFKINTFKGFIAAFLLSIPVAFAHRILAVFLGKEIQLWLTVIDMDYYNRVKNYFTAIIAGGTINDLIFIWIIIGIYLFIDFIKKFKSEKEHNLLISKELTDSKLQTLQGQLQPHFLFNTLHTVSSLMEENVEKAQSIMSRLADFLRYSLDYQDRKFASLNDEIKFIQNYLDIESERFRDRLTIRYSIADHTKQLKIPAFILQPFVENAIRHGVGKSSKVNQIELCTSMINDRLVVTISQNGDSIPIEEIMKSKGIGITNSRKRLLTIYQSNFELKFMNDSGLTVRIDIPNQVAEK